MQKRFIKVFILSLVAFSIIYGAVGMKISQLENLRKEKNVFYAEEDVNKDNKDISPLHKDEILFLLAGIDHNNLSDTLILCKTNFKSGEIDLVSIPRDSRVYVKGKLDKITHSHNKGGIDVTIKTIEDFLDIELDYYVRVDFEAVKAIVNGIDGVDIDVQRNMWYVDTTAGEELYIDIKKGPQTLNGDKALEFLRFRNYPDGDADRVKAQQQFMEELIKQTLQIKNITKWSNLLETYYSYVDTNISTSEILKGMRMAAKWDREKINMHTIPGVGEYIGKISYYIVDEEGTKELVSQVLKDYRR